ncbi:MAG: aegerolysin family protein [Pseudonocardiales bacterium]|nr:aegerolysin family protein [Pseudonocardiales bacterium]
MAYAQWIRIIISAEVGGVSVQNAYRDWGKFYQCPNNKDHELSDSEINEIRVPEGEIGYVCSCGRSDASSGTEGTIDLYDYDRKVKIGTFYWDCPWGSKYNSWTWTKGSNNYMVEMSGGNKYGGAIGDVTLTVAKKKRVLVPQLEQGSQAEVDVEPDD